MKEDAVLYICVTILTIMCIGEPDIIDGLIKLLNK